MIQKEIIKAAKVLKAGGVIALPTETVMGLAACLNCKAATKRIYKIKKRAGNKPLQILVANFKQAKKLGQFNKLALSLAQELWPGPLTLVVPAKRGSGLVGLRVPAHEATLSLLKRTGPLAATSANLAGQQPLRNSSQVKKVFPQLDFVFPGKADGKKASTVIEISQRVKILRP